MNPLPSLSIKEYTYELPEELIARYPLAERDMSRLLVYRNGTWNDASFREIGRFLPEQSMLVFNNTRVIQARLRFRKETGSEIEIFCLEPLLPADVQMACRSTSGTIWKCMVGNSRKWKHGVLQQSVPTSKGTVMLEIERGEPIDNACAIEFRWDSNAVTFAELIEVAGVTPIPPYLHRESEALDEERYQTVYSSQKGSVAAPTAGLHFTPQLLSQLRNEGKSTLELTLHVGAGTFQPVQSPRVAEHVMHTEHFVVEKAALVNLLNHHKSVTAVGTTSVRTLESMYWLGVKLLCGDDLTQGVQQWDAYHLPAHFSVKESLEALLHFMDLHQWSHFQSKTAILIVPGYQFKMVDVLITNFHQPNSTLLLLIAAFIGPDWKRMYAHAVAHQYRFLSYGDSSILYRNALSSNSGATTGFAG